MSYFVPINIRKKWPSDFVISLGTTEHFILTNRHLNIILTCKNWLCHLVICCKFVIVTFLTKWRVDHFMHNYKTIIFSTWSYCYITLSAMNYYTGLDTIGRRRVGGRPQSCTYSVHMRHSAICEIRNILLYKIPP